MGAIKTTLPTLPPQLGEIMTGIFTFASMSSGIFHRMRTGEGQVAHMAQTRIGAWASSCLLPLAMSGDKPDEIERRFIGKDGMAWWKEQFPAFQTYKTKDDAWIISLCVPLPQLFKYVSALGVKFECWSSLIGTIAWGKISGIFKGGVPLSAAAWTAFAKWTLVLQREIGKKTILEWKEFAKTHDLWWAPVSAPANVFENTQARAINAISVTDGRVDILSPVQLTQ